MDETEFMLMFILLRQSVTGFIAMFTETVINKPYVYGYFIVTVSKQTLCLYLFYYDC